MFNLKLHDDEEVLGMYRQAEILLSKYVLVIFLLIYLPASYLIRYELLYQFRWYLFIWTLMVLGYGIHKYLLWLLNVYIVTDMRVVKVAYTSLIAKTVTETPLEHITRIGYKRKGFLAAIFRFGDVDIFCAGLEHPIELNNLKHPENVQHDLWKIVGPKPGHPQA
jgi:hypothetical protein